jgi:putative acetyltransferase
MTIKRTDSDDRDFKKLAAELELELEIIDGIDHSDHAVFNKIDKLDHVLISYENDLAIACGGIRPYTDDLMEVKRMYVRDAYRGKGIATSILNELEQWSKELGYKYSILETGKNQPEAIALYNKNGYQLTVNFGQYKTNPNSVCFEKLL